MARKPYRMTPARRAALKKAQAASARKRSRGALAKNVARGAIGSKGGSRKTKYKAARKAGKYVAIGAAAVAVGVGVAYGANRAGKSYANAVKKNGDRRRQREASLKYPHHRRAPQSQASKNKSSVKPSAPKKTSAATHKRREETRLRQLRKVGDRGLYNAGLGSSGTNTITMGSAPSRKRKRKGAPKSKSINAQIVSHRFKGNTTARLRGRGRGIA